MSDYLALTLLDKNYPQSLKLIDSPPPRLYLKGNDLSLFKKRAIAVVGSRRPTGYGRETTKKLVKQLVDSGFVIVSGMARGIDSLAHWTALNSGGETIAVFGNGVDVVYPPENKKLYQEIIKNGLIVSEFPPKQKPFKKAFLIRNRIIAGLSEATLVIEAARRSGTINIARLTAEQGKDVFAVPGPINSLLSEGTAWLIQQGAKLVYKLEDILEEIGSS